MSFMLILQSIQRKKMEKLYDSDKATVLVGDYCAGEPALSYDGLMSDEMEKAMQDLRAFMFEHVYKNPAAKSEEEKVGG